MSVKEYPYLKDKDFLKQVDELPISTLYGKIVLLNWQEQPLQEIQGKIIDGNISINGDSSIRRTCNLSTFVEGDSYNFNDLNELFSLNKKVNIEIGINNPFNLYTEYPVLWFPQGYYVIMDLSLNHSLSGTNISLSLKDKMVLLNGECGGMLPATVLFNEIEDYDEKTGVTTITNPTIYQIIQEAVHHYGEIDLSKIIINDIDLKIKQVMRWMGDKPLYYRKILNNGRFAYTYSLSEKTGYNPIYSGDDAGYVYHSFVYPDELIGEAGQSVCTILDTIKNLLGNYEYFFDIWGNFVFQEKKNYLNIRQTTSQLQENLSSEDYFITNKQGMNVYDFNNSKLINSISNSPKYSNIKNDFIVWGKRKTADGLELPIRYHLAIDKKPVVRSSYEKVKLYITTNNDGTQTASLVKKGLENEKEITFTVQDWRAELFIRGLEADSTFTNTYSSYYIELMNEWVKSYNFETGKYFSDITNHPNNLDYYLDIIDEDSKIGQYSIDNIGKRTQVLVDDSINCLFEPEVPNVIFINTEGSTRESDLNECQSRGDNYTQIPPSIFNNLSIGGVHNSAFVAIRDLLYQYTNYNETISVSMIPVYHLEPNTRISILDEQSGTNGDFIITNISIPLKVGSTMNFNATKALEKV